MHVKSILAVLLVALASACHAADALTLRTEEGGNVRFSAFGAKMQPMQRRADDPTLAFVAFVNEGHVGSSDVAADTECATFLYEIVCR